MKQFYEELGKLRRKGWVAIHSNGVSIRLRVKNGKRLFCPLTAVCWMKKHVFFDVNDYKNARKKLGLNERNMVNIVSGADRGIASMTRRRMVRALYTKSG